jgi:hypothetical protein
MLPSSNLKSLARIVMMTHKPTITPFRFKSVECLDPDDIDAPLRSLAPRSSFGIEVKLALP